MFFIYSENFAVIFTVSFWAIHGDRGATFPEIVGGHVLPGAVNFAAGALGRHDSLAIEQHVHDNVVLLVKDGAWDGPRKDTFSDDVLKVANRADLGVVKLVPLVELLGVKVCPIVLTVVHDHSAKDVG